MGRIVNTLLTGSGQQKTQKYAPLADVGEVYASAGQFVKHLIGH